MALMASTSAPTRSLWAVCVLGTLSLLAVHLHAAPSLAAETGIALKPAAAIGANEGGANAAKPVAKPDVRPLWNELTPMQQQALAPLAQEWNKLDSNHKTKWLAISNKYPAMNPEQQKRLQENIRGWAKLTPEQHRIARESYARAKKLNPEQKTAQWEQYQQLPEEQKQKLAADAAAKKHIANLPNPQNKTKIVEPLKSAKKATATHIAIPQFADHATAPPPAATAQTPSPSSVPVINK